MSNGLKTLLFSRSVNGVPESSAASITPSMRTKAVLQ
ncbi:MAG: hypothetical protein BWY59_00102 [Verrucomicrobia bacterium ADurb.Bin345]|nr:MAG: hypothetical protein BWY59_00102 [Verrucomicrobia bacterium ADurb.Bin345]